MNAKVKIKVGWYFGRYDELKKTMLEYSPDFSEMIIGPMNKLILSDISNGDRYQLAVTLYGDMDPNIPIIGKYNLMISVFSAFDHKIKDALEGLEKKLDVRLSDAPKNITEYLDSALNTFNLMQMPEDSTPQ